LCEFTERMIKLRDEHPVFRRTTFFAGEPDENGLADVFWFRPDGRRMGRREWDARGSGRLGVFINGNALRTVTPEGEPLHDDSFIVIFNAHHEPTTFVLPTRRFGRRWQVEVSTVVADPSMAEGTQLPARAQLTVEPRSLHVLKRMQ
jgi:isoamylase